MTITNRTRLTLPLVPWLYGAFSSIGRAPVCGTGGHGFEPRKAPPSNRDPGTRLPGFLVKPTAHEAAVIIEVGGRVCLRMPS